MRPDERAARGIGYVPQGREIFPNLSVAENLRIGLLGRPPSAGNGRGAGDYEDVFGLFLRLKQLLSRKGGVLSGGEQQQLAIARVLLVGALLFWLHDSSPRKQNTLAFLDRTLATRNGTPFAAPGDDLLDVAAMAAALHALQAGASRDRRSTTTQWTRLGRTEALR